MSTTLRAVVPAPEGVADGAPDTAEIRVLGRLHVWRADGVRVGPRAWRTAATADLVRLLAVQAGEPVAVDVLLEALWPDVDERRGRASLRTAASHVRRVLGPEHVVREADGLALQGVWVDAPAFGTLAGQARRQLAGGRHARALRTAREAEWLYLGDFRTHVDSALAQAHRRRLADLHRDLLADGADAAVHLGWMRDAVDHARRMLAVEPTSERAWRALMSGLAGLGEVGRALAAYEECRRTLVDELGVDPSPPTRALHLQLLTDRPPEPQPEPFVDRGPAVAWLRSRADGPVGGDPDGGDPDGGDPDGGDVALVVGPALVGKSRLVARACADLPGRAVETDVADLDQALPGADDASAPGAPAGALLGAVRELATAGPDAAVADRRAPAVLHVADAHRLRLRLAQTLAAALGGLPRRPLLVLTARTAPPAAVLAPLLGAGGRLHRLDLGPLEQTDVAALAAEVLGDSVSPGLLAELMDAGQGVPGVVAATLDAWRRTGRVAASSEGLVLLGVSEAEASPDPRDVMSGLLERLADDELDVVRLCAVLGRPVSASTLEPLLDVPGERVRTALERLTDLAVLAPHRDGFVFRDALQRDAVHAWLRPSARRRLHLRVAERAPVGPAARAEHWLLGGEPALARAAVAEASAEALAEGRYEQARLHLLRLLELDPVDAAPQDRVALSERLGDVCAVLGRQDEAAAAFRAAAGACRDAGLPGVDRLDAKAERVSAGDWPEERSPALALARSVEAVAAGAPAVVDLRALEDEALDGALGGDQAEQRLREALDVADRASDPVAQAQVRILLSATVTTPRRNFAHSRAWAQEALSLSVDPEVRARALLELSRPDALFGNAAVVASPLDRAAALAADAANDDVLARIDVLRCLVAHDVGAADAGARYAALSAAAAAGHGVAGDEDWAWASVRMAVERGDLDLAARLDAQPVAAGTSHAGRHLRAAASALLDVARGDTSRAVVTLEDALDDAVARSVTFAMPEVATRLIVLEAPTDVRSAREHFELLDWAGGGDAWLPREAVLRMLARAAIRAALGDADGAVAAASIAVDTAEAKGLAFLAGQAHLARARHLLAAGRPTEARVARAAGVRSVRAAGGLGVRDLLSA